MQPFGEWHGVAKSRRKGLGYRLIGWIAAYALVLNAVLAGAVATQLAAKATGSSAFELCLGPDGAPATGHGQAQHEGCAIHCFTLAGALPLLAFALIALLFPPRAPAHVASLPAPGACRFCRAGRSRAPPLPA
jgi:hypothetical protein